MLNGFVGQDAKRGASRSASPRPSLKAAQLADVVSGFYVGRAIAGPGGGARRQSGGHDRHARRRPRPKIPRRHRHAGEEGPRRRAALHQSASRACSTRPTTRCCIRNMLLAQNDGNATIVLAGPGVRTRAAARRCTARGRRSRRSASSWSSRSGRFPAGAAGPGASRPTSRRREKCSPSGRRRSSPSAPKSARRCRIPGASIEKDFALGAGASGRRRLPGVQADAVRRARRRRLAPCSMPRIRRTAFKLSRARHDRGARTTGARSSRQAATGKHRYLIVDPAQKSARSQSLYTALVSGAAGASARPRPRGRGAHSTPTAVDASVPD